ncbi:hypothetical protein ACFY0P_12085 [Streptomyces sp. NPDC001714]|uniref:hypothetical protein n=1 Tax=Streptomyces sp. NPDC001714 TaxID=3364603 RepID=UPI0036B2F937
MTAAELDRLDSEGKLLLRWQKVLGPERAEHYAFPRVPPHGIGVFGGNDALIENASSIRPGTEPLDRLCKVLVVCDPEVRRARLLARSPELLCDPVELAARLASSPQRVRDCADLVLDNTDGFGAADLDHLEKTVLGGGSRSSAET